MNLAESFILAILLSSCSKPTVEYLLEDVCAHASQEIKDRNADKDYILLASNDGLDQEDSLAFDIGLSCLGFQARDVNLNTTIDTIDSYLTKSPYFLYFSGHGSPTPGIYIAGSEIGFYDATIFNADYVFISACDTLEIASRVMRLFSPRTKVLMGYSHVLYDPADLQTAITMVGELGKGYSLPAAFYNAHKNNKELRKNWVMYIREGDSIVEYSERSRNKYGD